MYLQNFIGDKAAVLDAAMKHPALSPKRKPTMDAALKAVISTVESMTAKAVVEKFAPLIQDVYDMYTIDNGEYEDAPDDQRDDWSAGLDDKVEECISPLTPVLSANWLGVNTIDTRLWEENAVVKLAESMGREVFKQLSFGKEPGQVLSNAGVTRADVEAYFEQHMQPKTEEETKSMSDNLDDNLQTVIGAIHAQVGRDFDIMEVSADLEGITDDDEILAGSAAQRLGLDEDALNVVQMYALEVGAEACAETMLKMLHNYAPGGKKAAPAAPAVPAAPAGPAVPPPPPGAPTPVKAASAAQGFDASRVLSLIKLHSSIKETELATALGVSRSTFVNWTTGKTNWSPDAGQLETLRNRVVSDVNGLTEALCGIDGVPFERAYE